MKIALLGPSPVPYTIGGVENLMWGLYETINNKTSHQAELIKLPSRENDFWNLIDSYYSFYKLDLSHFDKIICLKYPTWMIKHDNCIYYVAHRLRGLYDTYNIFNLSLEVKKGNNYIDNILNYMDENPYPSSLDEYFDMLFSLKNYLSEIPKEYFIFPGPFIRLIIHYMDNYGMSIRNKSNIFAISYTVKNRKEYFPNNANVQVIYPPTTNKYFKSEGFNHIFFVSRLDGPKRIDMLIEAMKFVKGEIKLYIAGTGPKENELKTQASVDKRIVFLGFVNDNEVEDYYANSLVIPYFPYDEDYGLITIEAMMHKKPVITTNDSGGPTEFVENGQTGFCVNFDPQAIGEKIDYFIQNPNEAKRMGLKAYEKVKNITWENTVEQLLNETVSNALNFEQKSILQNKERKKIMVATTYPIFPPLGGGQVRVFNLFKYVSIHHNVEIISLTNADQQAFSDYIAENLKEIRIPKTPEHQQKEWDLFEKHIKIPISDISLLSLWDNTPEYSIKINKSLDNSNIIVLSHPYALNAIKKHLREQIIIYEAQDVAYQIKKQMLPNTNFVCELLKELFEAEKECCEISKWIITCSEEDRQAIHMLYNINLDKIVVVPNGVDCSQIKFTNIEERLENKNRIGLKQEKIGIFMGSWHGPNLEACEKIFEFAHECNDVNFLIMGSQCKYFENRKIPGNVGMLGIVSDEQKDNIFRNIDFALNPMLSGSGTNLKMFDYMAAGVPIITTPFGTRGINNNDLFHVAEICDIPKIINELDLCRSEEMVKKARKTVEELFDWKVIADIMLHRII